MPPPIHFFRPLFALPPFLAQSILLIVEFYKRSNQVFVVKMVIKFCCALDEYSVAPVFTLTTSVCVSSA